MTADEFERRIRHYEEMAQACRHRDDRSRFRGLAEGLRHELLNLVTDRLKTARPH